MDKKVKIREEAVGATARIAIVQTFSVRDIDDSWSRGEYGLAVLKAAITVETILFYHLLNALSLGSTGIVRDKIRKLIDDRPLGWYMDWCTSLKVFSKGELNKLKPLVIERNKIAHEREYIDCGRGDTKIRKWWEMIINIAKKFIQVHGKVEVV